MWDVRIGLFQSFFFFYDVVYNILILYTHNRFCRAHTYTDIIWWIAFGWNHGRIIKKRTNGRTPWLGIMAGQGIPTAATCCSIAHIYIYILGTTALHTTVWPVNVYKISERTDLVVFVLILFPQMSNILLLKPFCPAFHGADCLFRIQFF